MDYVNDPSVISSIANFVSINSCIAVDLYGQICSEAVGTRQISGTGGQLDFVTGAYRSPGGMAFITLKAARTDKVVRMVKAVRMVRMDRMARAVTEMEAEIGTEAATAVETEMGTETVTEMKAATAVETVAAGEPDIAMRHMIM